MNLISTFLLLLSFTLSIPVEDVGKNDWHLELVGVPIWSTKINFSNLHLVITPTTYAALSAHSGNLVWRKPRLGHRLTLVKAICKHDYLMVIEAEGDLVTAKLFRIEGGELVYDFPFSQLLSKPQKILDDQYSGDIVKLKGKVFTFMKDEEAVRILDQSRKTNEYRVEDGYRVKHAQLYEGQVQIILYGTDDYKILAMDFNKGAEISVVEEKRFLPDYGANIGLMMLVNRERVITDYELGVDVSEDQVTQIDRTGYFFAIHKRQKKDFVLSKLIFAGERPKAGGFEPKKILFDDSQSLSRRGCETSYSLLNNEKDLLWTEKCSSKDDTMALKVSNFSVQEMKSQVILENAKWNLEQAHILGIQKGRTGSVQLLIEDSGNLIKVEIRKSITQIWQRPEDLINTETVALYHEQEEEEKAHHKQKDVHESWTDVPSLVINRYIQHAADFMDFLNQSSEWFTLPKDKFRLEGLLLALTKHNRLYALRTEDHRLEWAVSLGQERVTKGRIVTLEGGKVLVLSRSRYSVVTASTGRVTINQAYHPETEHIVVKQLERTGQTVLLINKVKLTSKVIIQENPHVSLPSLDLMYETEEALKRIRLENGKGTNLWSLSGERDSLVSITRNSNKEADLQLTQHGPSGEIVRKYVNSNTLMRVVQGEDDDDLEIQIIDAVTGRFLYKRILAQATDPLLLIDDNIYIVKYKSLESGDAPARSKSISYDDDEDDQDFVKEKKPERSDSFGIHGQQLLVIQMMEPFRNETVSGIIKSHLEAVDYSQFWKGVTQHIEEVSAYSRDDPIIHELAFVLPLNARDVKSITMTQTTRGITGKYLLLSTNAGQIVTIPLTYLIPSRRPLPKFSQFGAQQDSEEGKFYYDAMIVSPAKAVLNYNRQILGLEEVFSFPTRMESTTIVVGIGGDIYYTKYAPEREFDKLTDKTGSWIMIVVCILSVFLIKGSRWYLMRRTKKEVFLMS